MSSSAMRTQSRRYMLLMLRVAPVLFLLVACAEPRGEASSQEARDPAKPADEALRQQLLARVERDQEARLALAHKQQQGQAPDAIDIERLLTVDTANTAWLKQVIAESGWPGRSLVGSDGANAAFLLVQHADHDTAFQAQVLSLLERAYAVGEAEGQQVALLTDRIASARGEPQMYGTQADLSGGRVVLKAIADSANLDSRRAAVGLPPIHEYVRLLDSVYTDHRRP